MQKGSKYFVFIAIFLVFAVLLSVLASAFSFSSITGNVITGAKITGNAITAFIRSILGYDSGTRSVSVQSVPTATRVFSSSTYSPGVPITVVIFASVSDLTVCSFAITDVPPVGWTISAISGPGGGTLGGDGKIRWTPDGPDPSCGTTPASFIINYTATPPAGDTGIKTFSGTIMTINTAGDIVESQTGGSTTISPPASTYTVSVTKQGTGSGTVTSNPSGISCGGTCSASFNTGTTVILSAVASAGSTFTGWSNGCTGTGTCTVSAAASPIATFTLIPFDYSLSVPGLTIQQGSTATQTVTVTRTAGTAQSVTVNVGTLPTGVTLTSANNLACTPTAGSCTVTFSYSATTSATATTSNIAYTGTSSGVATKSGTFALTVSAIPTYSVSVTKQGTGSGTVTSNPSGISCGGTCSASFNTGTTVILSAVASAGSTFTGWSNGCTGTGTCTVSAAASPIATFTLIPFDYSLSVPGLTIQQGSTATQTVTVTRTAGTAQSVTVNVGTLPTGVTLTSANNLACTPTAGSCTVTFSYSATTSATATTSNIAYTGTSSGVATKSGTFALTVSAIPTYSVSVTKQGTGSGTVTSNPSGISCGGTCSTSFN